MWVEREMNDLHQDHIQTQNNPKSFTNIKKITKIFIHGFQFLAINIKSSLNIFIYYLVYIYIS
jgi:hypothetical protein